jgi:predicted Zn-dependent protease
VTLLSAASEREIGQEAAREVETSMGLVRDAPLAGYVEAIGRRLAEHSPRRDVPYTVQIVDTPEPNAFALPGGFVYISRGLLALAGSEDELAGAIGHEIGHVAARHAVQRVSRSAPIGIITGLPAAITGVFFPRVGEAIADVGGAATDLILAPYDRDQEREADRVGQELAARAGWDPAALGPLLATIERAERLQAGAGRRASFLSSHPSTPERVAATARTAGELVRATPRPIAASRAEFLRRLEGLIVGDSQARGVFRGQRFLHPDLDFAVVFPAGWPTQNSPRSTAAAAPDGGAVTVVRIAGSGDDPVKFAADFGRRMGTPFREPPRQAVIGGLPAARGLIELQTSEGAFVLDLAWIAHRAQVFSVAGVTRPGRLPAYRAGFAQVIESFHPLTAGERASLTPTRLAIVPAREGESVAQLLARTPGAAWSAAEAAVANGRQPEERLRAGDLLKVAVNR